MRISKSMTRAFCVELQREVSIVAARREFFSLEAPRQRFEFLCSSAQCRANGVKVTGVNYDVKPQEQETFVSAHFRANPHHQHDARCEWVGDTEDEQTQQTDDEPHGVTATRKARRKLDDYIDVFEPSLKGHIQPVTVEPGSDRSNTPALTDNTSLAEKSPRAGEFKADTLRSTTRTHNLERLVDSYRQARATLSNEELALIKLRVPGHGEMALRSYFRHIKYAQLGDNGRVLYGGGLVERFGQGFRFKYFDRLQGKPVFLYVSPAQMQAYRARGYINELLSHAADVKFFTLYALASVSESPSGKSISVEVEDLRHLVIVLGPGV